MKKKIRATMYVVLGSMTIIAAVAFVIFMYFSTWLPGMYLIRKVLYVAAFAVALLATWFVHEGYTYLERNRRRW